VTKECEHVNCFFSYLIETFYNFTLPFRHRGSVIDREHHISIPILGKLLGFWEESVGYISFSMAISRRMKNYGSPYVSHQSVAEVHSQFVAHAV
jgi:hypothetical protein